MGFIENYKKLIESMPDTPPKLSTNFPTEEPVDQEEKDPNEGLEVGEWD